METRVSGLPGRARTQSGRAGPWLVCKDGSSLPHEATVPGPGGGGPIDGRQVLLDRSLKKTTLDMGRSPRQLHEANHDVCLHAMLSECSTTLHMVWSPRHNVSVGQCPWRGLHI